MNHDEARLMRELARELRLPVSAIETAVECGLFSPDEPMDAQRRALRRMRRLMRDLGVNAPGAALLVRLSRDLEGLRIEVTRLRRFHARRYENWQDGQWHERNQ